jgi:hypothetical protein
MHPLVQEKNVLDYIDRVKGSKGSKGFSARTNRSLNDVVKRLIRAGEQSREVPDSLDSQSLRQLRLMKGPRTGLRGKR